MEKTYLLANPSCTKCRQFSKTGELKMNEGKPYGSNIFNIPDSFDRNSINLNATKFYGFSLSEFGRFVYQVNGQQFESQKIAFPNLDAVYVTRKNNKWMLGVS